MGEVYPKLVIRIEDGEIIDYIGTKEIRIVEEHVGAVRPFRGGVMECDVKIKKVNSIFKNMENRLKIPNGKRKKKTDNEILLKEENQKTKLVDIYEE